MRWQEELLPLLEAAKTGALGEVPSPSSVKRGFVTAGAKVATTGESRVDIVTVRVPSPPASNYAVHKSMQGNKRANTKPELLVRERLR